MMEEYISRNKLIKFISENKHRLGITVANSCNFREIANMIDAEDVAPVVHAAWMIDEFGRSCSACEEYIDDDARSSEYCPNCGARMDG